MCTKTTIEDRKPTQSLFPKDVFIIDKYRCHYLRSVDDIQPLISEISGLHFFLQPPFLSVIEEKPPSGLSVRYVFIEHEGEAVGVLYFQIKKIDLGESMEFQQVISLRKKVALAIRRTMASTVNFNTLICGNLLQTGPYGFYFSEYGGVKLGIDFLDKCTDWLIRKLKSESISVAGVLLKDFPSDNQTNDQDANRLRYHRFAVQPDMVIEIPGHWSGFNDYLRALRSKYRVRTGRAIKKFNGIDIRKLEEEDLIIYQDQMVALYRNVASEASFNLFILHRDYFLRLLQNLGEQCHITGYFIGGKLVAFQTMLLHENHVFAHFLGYDAVTNQSHHLYHNMLLDIIRFSIESGCTKIYFSRTAMEIKSSVGAIPKDWNLYLKARNPIMNALVAFFLRILVPIPQWKQRHPFLNNQRLNN
ncbi:MAG TPA: GNAT family N-acetyltransferase [Saprospiraceae bacterium]|nr:GNAT family N-acetyltransferase [Saprospiraceae bacterium]